MTTPCAATQGKCVCFFGAHGLLGCSASTSCQQFVPPSVWQVKSVPPMAGHPRFVRPLARALALCRVVSTGAYRRCVGCKAFFDCRYRVRHAFEPTHGFGGRCKAGAKMMTKGDRKKLSMTDQAHQWNDGVQLPPSLARARCDPCTELGHTPRRTEFPIGHLGHISQ